MKLNFRKINLKQLFIKSNGNVLFNRFALQIWHKIKLLVNKQERKRYNLFRWLAKEVKYNVNSIWNTKHFNKLKRKALSMHASTGKQYFIIPTKNNHCMIVDTTWREWYNKSVPKDKRIPINKWYEWVYFMTPAGTNSMNQIK